MSLELPFGIKVLNPLPLDHYAYAADGTPWNNVAAANAGVVSGVRYLGMTVIIDDGSGGCGNY